MIKQALLYEEELQKENIKTWNNINYQWWHGGQSGFPINLDKNSGNSENHNFVSVDKYDNVIGYIGYSVDYVSKSAFNFGIVSFNKPSIIFARDLVNCIKDVFVVYNFNKIEWYCYADNPAIRGYRNLINKFGGKEVGYLRQSSILMDGKYHDTVIFEILKSELNYDLINRI